MAAVEIVHRHRAEPGAEPGAGRWRRRPRRLEDGNQGFAAFYPAIVLARLVSLEFADCRLG
jgi:hypothetical protein